ncbi:GPW/gp25 family protein [Flavobacterium procerum]|uniref:GPW/gp25 family protein n=1 Tax=Flavobacterium procerum TaxID=1455569 RepID=A0ABV6BVV4_9FLAO
MELKSFLGTGWKFPPSFSKETKNVILVSDETDIAESLHILLSTDPGERLMRPEYGCNLRKFMFERQDTSFVTGLNNTISKAILNFEARVDFIDAKVVTRNELDGVLHIEVNYKIIITNTRHNIVFPFYLLEGTNL